MPDSFEESLRRASAAANALTEEELAEGLDGQHASDPQGGTERSNPTTSRIARPLTTWTAEADAGKTNQGLKR